MKLAVIAGAWLLLAGVVPVAHAANPQPATIPALREWQGGDGSFQLRRSSRIVIPRRHRRRLRTTARLLAGDLKALRGRRPRIVATRRKRLRPGDIRLGLGGRDPALGGEGYRMRIAGAVRIAANRPAGAFYGTRTVLQLLRRAPALPRGRTRDWPRYPERGLMVDVGRKYFTPGWLESHIRELAYLKLNYLHLHLSDNQGFRIESESHPEIVSERHLTKREVRSLIALAARHHITVVPEIDMPGHMEAALRPHPELRLQNAVGQREAAVLDVTNDAALRFARDLIEEYLPLFPGPYWHVGADEVIPFAAYPAYPSLLDHARERYGSNANAKDAIHGFVNWVDGIVRSYGKTTRMWHDDVGGGSAVKRDSRIVAEWWTDFSPLSDARPPTPQDLLAAGHRIMNAGWFPTYYVHGPLGSARPDMRTAYESWEVNEFYGPFVYDDTAQNPPDVISPDEPRNLGSKLHVWNDDPEEATEDEIAEGIFPRLRVIAQKTWASPLLVPAYSDFEEVMSATGHAPSAMLQP
jgi:hexosaminidase